MSATPAQAFAAWCAFLAPTEGGLSLDANDSGNFTPDGRLVGSKFGISAHSYPDVDIPNLTIEQANLLRKVDFWDKVRGDELPGPVAFILAEAAYGSGPGRAIMQMQNVVGVTADGVFGPGTMAALTAMLAARPDGIEKFVIEYEAQRLLFEATLGDKWDRYKVGWTRRMFGGTAIALGLDDPAPAAPAAPAGPVASVAPAVAAPSSVMPGEGTFVVTVNRVRGEA